MKIRALALSLALLLSPWAANATFIPSPGSGPVSPGTAALQSILGGGVFNSTSPTLTNGQQSALQLDAAGNLNVDVQAGSIGVNPTGPGVQAGALLVVLPTDMPALQVKQPDVTTTGSVAAGTVNSAYSITLGNGVQTVTWNTSGLTGTGAVITPEGSSNGGSSFAPIPGITNALNALPQSTTTVDLNNFCTTVGGLGAAELLVTTAGSGATVNIVATASVSQCPAPTVPTTLAPGTTVALASAATGGATSFTILSAASNNSTSLKSTPGTLFSPTWIQTTTTPMDIRFYDTSGAPTCSSATGMKLNYVVQTNTISPGGSPVFPDAGIAFTSGIGVCITGITGAISNNDNTSAVLGLVLTGSFK